MATTTSSRGRIDAADNDFYVRHPSVDDDSSYGGNDYSSMSNIDIIIIVTVVVGVPLLCFLGAMWIKRHYPGLFASLFTTATPEPQATGDEHQQEREEREKHYQQFLKDHGTTLQESDFFETDSCDPSQEADEETGLPCDDRTRGLCVKKSDGSQVEMDEAKCAVCLCDYEAGDTVVWSALGNCPHIFHEGCILTWVAKGKDECPHCRQPFVPDKLLSPLEPKEQEESTELQTDEGQLSSV